MQGPNKNDYDVLTFDCYGTLIDWGRGINDYLIPTFLAHDAHVIGSWVLGYFSEMEPQAQAQGGSYREVLADVVKRFGSRLGFNPTDEQSQGFAESIGAWPAFDDTIDALKRLSESFDLAIVSNVDSDLFDATNKALEVTFKHIVTAGDVGVFKPDPKMFDAARKAIGADARILHVAQSLYHDIAPANAKGIDTVWINRYGGTGGAARAAEAEPKWTFDDLATFTDSILATGS